MGYYSNIVIGHATTTFKSLLTHRVIHEERTFVENLATFNVGCSLRECFHSRNKEFFFALCGDGNTMITKDSYDEPIGVCSPEEFIKTAEEKIRKYPDWTSLKICLNTVKSYLEVYGDSLVILHYGH